MAQSGEVMNISELLGLANERGASDLHLAGGNPPILRVDGELRRINDTTLSGADVRTMVHEVMSEAQRAFYDVEKEIDFSFEFDAHTRFRVNAFTNRNGAAVVFRTISSEQLTLEELGAPRPIRRLAELEKGLVLVTGPTGSGKSTTLAAMIDHINTTASRHILTIEDPVEFIHTPKKSLINQREVGHDTHSFSQALRSALREDPEVILVGEMRDHETIALALTAAETGHLVMGTLHTSSAAKTIDRIIDVFPAGDKDMVRAMLAGSLQGVIAQTLLKRADDKGRIAAFEILLGTTAVRNLIRENKVPQIYSMMQVGSDVGMQTMADAMGLLVDSEIVSESEAASRLSSVTAGDTPKAGGGSSATAADQDGEPGAPAPRIVRANPNEYTF